MNYDMYFMPWYLPKWYGQACYVFHKHFIHSRTCEKPLSVIYVMGMYSPFGHCAAPCRIIPVSWIAFTPIGLYGYASFIKSPLMESTKASLSSRLLALLVYNGFCLFSLGHYVIQPASIPCLHSCFLFVWCLLLCNVVCYSMSYSGEFVYFRFPFLSIHEPLTLSFFLVL